MEIVTGSGDSQYDLREAQMRKKTLHRDIESTQCPLYTASSDN